VKNAKLQWDAQAGGATNWMGLTLSVACFKKGAGDVKLTPIANVGNAGTPFDISGVPGCTGQFDQVEISVQPVAANTVVFSKTADFKFMGQQ
jgi:hypothetical protein